FTNILNYIHMIVSNISFIRFLCHKIHIKTLPVDPYNYTNNAFFANQTRLNQMVSIHIVPRLFALSVYLPVQIKTLAPHVELNFLHFDQVLTQLVVVKKLDYQSIYLNFDSIYCVYPFDYTHLNHD